MVGSGEEKGFMVGKVDWTEGAGVEFPRVLLSPDMEAQIHVASLTTQACLFPLPQKFCCEQLDRHLLQLTSKTVRGTPLAAGAN